jgi:hypothetical protein
MEGYSQGNAGSPEVQALRDGSRANSPHQLDANVVSEIQKALCAVKEAAPPAKK